MSHTIFTNTFAYTRCKLFCKWLTSFLIKLVLLYTSLGGAKFSRRTQPLSGKCESVKIKTSRKLSVVLAASIEGETVRTLWKGGTQISKVTAPQHLGNHTTYASGNKFHVVKTFACTGNFECLIHTVLHQQQNQAKIKLTKISGSTTVRCFLNFMKYNSEMFFVSMFHHYHRFKCFRKQRKSW